MGELNELGLKYHTDKASSNHGYLKNYEKYFSEWKDREFNLLEIGVGSGGSISMWREFFPKATVFGVDNNPEISGRGDHVLIGDGTDGGFLRKLSAGVGGFDIVIDDGSHVGSDMIKTFKIMFPIIKSGGWYVLEDSHCFYHEHYNQGSGAFEFFSGLGRDVDVAGRGLTGNTEVAIRDHNFPSLPEYSEMLDYIVIHPSLWFFRRK